MISRTRSAVVMTMAAALVAMLALAGCGSSSKGLDLGGSSKDLTTTRALGALEARIVNADRTPAAGQAVLVSGTRAATTSISVTTDARGIIRLGSLAPGNYQLLIGAVAFRAPIEAGQVTTRLYNLGQPNVSRTDLGEMFILNGLGQTLSRLDTETGTIANNVVKAGKWPNAVAFYKGIGYIVNSGDNSIQRFNPVDGKTIDTTDLGAGRNPYYIAFWQDKAFVTNLLANQVQVLNLAEDKPVLGKTIDVGVQPSGLVVTNDKVFVFCTGASWVGSNVTYAQGTVHVLNAGTETVEAVLELGEKSNPQVGVVGSEGHVYVLCTGDYQTVGSSVLRINPRSNTLDGAPLPLTREGGIVSARAITIAPNGRAFVADQSGARIHVVDTKAHKVLRTGRNALDQGANPLDLAASANGLVWVFNFSDDQVRAFDAGSYARRYGPLGAGDGPMYGGTRERQPAAAVAAR